MSRMERLSGPGMRGATTGPGEISHRVFFSFNRARIFAKTHLSNQLLRIPFAKGNLAGLKNKNPLVLGSLIGEKLARIALTANQFMVTKTQGEVRYFNFFAGENKLGEKVVRIELH